MSIEQEAAQSDVNKLDFQWGWKRAAHDFETKGHFEPAHFPEGTCAYRGYEAFAKMIRDKRRVAA